MLHDINQSLCYSDEIVAMQDGRIRAQGLPEQIITPELVRSVYDVELEIREVDGKPFRDPGSENKRKWQKKNEMMINKRLIGTVPESKR